MNGLHGSRSEPSVQVVHLSLEMVEVAAVVDHEICSGKPLGAIGLSGNPCSGVRLVEPPVTHQPLHREIGFDIDHHESMEISSTRLDQQGNVEYHRVVGVAMLVQTLCDPSGNCRVHNGIQSGELVGLGKDPAREAGTVETAVCEKDLASECVHDARQGRLAGHLQLSGNRVGVYDGVTQAGEAGTDARFAAPDSAREADDSHDGDDATHQYLYARCRRIQP